MAAWSGFANWPERRVFIAGAGGAIGKILCPWLRRSYHVTGATRSLEKVDALHVLGIDPVVVDVFDGEALRKAVVAARPHIVVHLLTDLPFGLDPARMDEARIRNARIREVGTQNLIAAAVSAGVKRIVAQSISFVYAPGPMPFAEDAPLNRNAIGADAASVRAVASLERQVQQAPVKSVILRFGKLYGHGTGFDAPPPGGPIQVEAAADAVARALYLGEGLYNIAEDDGTVNSQCAKMELNWRSSFRVVPARDAFRIADKIAHLNGPEGRKLDLAWFSASLQWAIDQRKTKELFDELFVFWVCMNWTEDEYEGARDTLKSLETLMSFSSLAACVLMARLFAKASKLKVEYVCDSIIVWILKNKSPELKFQLELLAEDTPWEDVRKRYREWAGTM